MNQVIVIGAGLAGSEASWQMANRGIEVTLYEMKPRLFSPAHKSENFAELVCSNSLRSDQENSAVGLLKKEMLLLDSLIMQAAHATKIPAGKALAVNRDLFSAFITEKILTHPNIKVIREEVKTIDPEELTIIASGPLCSDALTKQISTFIGSTHLYFYDAISPIISADSIDFTKTFWADRWEPDKETPDYLNIPLNKEKYVAFVDEIINAEKVPTKNFEKEIHFEGCLPIEELARRGLMTLAFGPFKPVGLLSPNSLEKPFAVIQLRKENHLGTAFNLVGCQTKLTYAEQKRIFRTLPGLENAEFERLGSMHRNTYINSPDCLSKHGFLSANPNIFFTGQITGVEGYIESAASGLITGLIISSYMKTGSYLNIPNTKTALGALYAKLQTREKTYTPSNITFSMFSPLELDKKFSKLGRKALYTERAKQELKLWKDSLII